MAIPYVMTEVTTDARRALLFCLDPSTLGMSLDRTVLTAVA